MSAPAWLRGSVAWSVLGQCLPDFHQGSLGGFLGCLRGGSATDDFTAAVRDFGLIGASPKLQPVEPSSVHAQSHDLRFDEVGRRGATVARRVSKLSWGIVREGHVGSPANRRMVKTMRRIVFIGPPTGQSMKREKRCEVPPTKQGGLSRAKA